MSAVAHVQAEPQGQLVTSLLVSSFGAAVRQQTVGFASSLFRGAESVARGVAASSSAGTRTVVCAPRAGKGVDSGWIVATHGTDTRLDRSNSAWSGA